MNVVEISGKMTRDPELRSVGQSQFPILSMNVAVENASGRYNPETRKTEVESGFYQVEVKGDYALNFQGLRKGDAVYVKGSLSQWTAQPKEGQDRGETKTRISADIVIPLTGGGGASSAASGSKVTINQAGSSGWDPGWPTDRGGF